MKDLVNLPELEKVIVKAVDYSQGDPDWYDMIRHREETGREFAEYNVINRCPDRLPVLTLAQLKLKFRPHKESYFVDKKVVQKHRYFMETVSDSHKDVRKLCLEARTFKVMSLNTEWDGKLKGPDGHYRVVVTYAVPGSALVLMFRDAMDTPQSIRNVLKDYSVAKIQSAIAKDVDILMHVGVEVRGLVDSGTVFMMVRPGTIDEGYGLKHQISAIWANCSLLGLNHTSQSVTSQSTQLAADRQVVLEDAVSTAISQDDAPDTAPNAGLFETNKCFMDQETLRTWEERASRDNIDYKSFKNVWQKYDKFSFPESFETGELSEKCKRHMAQGVLTPFATLFLATALEAVRLGYQDDDDVSLLLNQCLEICYSKSPKDVRQRRVEPRDQYWILPVKESRFQMNSRAKCQLIRHARGDIIEPFDSSMTMDERSTCAGQIWDTQPLPTSTAMKSKNYFMKETKSCQNCGSTVHQLQDCTFHFSHCTYPHIGNVANPDHSTYMCPDLMAYCKICKIRGHRQQEHQDHEVLQSPLELRTQFKKYAHLGKYSSLPFLYKSSTLKNYHFRASLSATTMSRSQPDLWMYCGRFAIMPEEDFKKTEEEKLRVTKNLDSIPEDVVWCKGDGD